MAATTYSNMKEEIPALTQMMKDLTTLSYKIKSQATKDQVLGIVNDLSTLREILNY